jgi:hypothetical protein
VLTARQHQAAGRHREYYIKWRGKSYLHCSWVREADIESVGRMFAHLRAKVRKFFQEQDEGEGAGEQDEDEGAGREGGLPAGQRASCGAAGSWLYCRQALPVRSGVCRRR